MVVQIAVGIPLEMIHGCLRTGMVYMSGVLAGTERNKLQKHLITC